MLLFTEVNVFTLRPEFVLAGDGLLHLINREAELLREFVNRIGLDHVAGLHHVGKRLVVDRFPGDVLLSAVLKRPEAGAAVHLELLRVGGPVAVENRVVAVTGLVFVGVERILVGAGLIHEALAFSVHAEPGLRSHPEHLRGALLQGLEAGLVFRTER